MPLGGRLHGLEIELRRVPGARAMRVIHPPRQMIGEHNHDWACVTLHVLGSYTEVHEAGEDRIIGPAAVLHPPKRQHANHVDEIGLETISIIFDPLLLEKQGFTGAPAHSLAFKGGAAVRGGRQLAALWTRPAVPETDLIKGLGWFLSLSADDAAQRQPPWLGRLSEMLDRETPPSTVELARELDLHPAWLRHAYREATGEGLQEMLRRKRVERAVLLLRESDQAPAEIAAATGFCDQSHLSRSFRAVIGRTPLQVRAEQRLLHPDEEDFEAPAPGLS